MLNISHYSKDNNSTIWIWNSFIVEILLPLMHISLEQFHIKWLSGGTFVLHAEGPRSGSDGR